MGDLRISEWRKLPMSLAELCIDTTLRCGQSFRWKKLRDNEWSCALRGRIVSLKQDSTYLHYRTIWPNSTNCLLTPSSVQSSAIEKLREDEETEALLRHYLNLSPDLTSLYEQWSSVDPNFKKRAPKFTGVRILKQDAWEALVSFICSSNNNIVRISQMVNNLCRHYGPLIGYIGDHAFHDFPPASALTGAGVEVHLRELGFGYRAKYIVRTASIVANEKPKGWLNDLSNHEIYDNNLDQKELPERGRLGYRKAHEELLQLQGVGPKVADCVCLMGLGWGESVPVDTHVWQFAQRDYKFGKGKHKSLTKATYDAVGDYFRQLWGKEAGWAHSVLFAADLKTFSEKVEMDVDEIKIKQEDGTLEETTVITKRKYVLEDVKVEFGEEKENEISLESSRTQRAKRRRWS